MIRLDLPPKTVPRPQILRKRNYFAGAASSRLTSDWLTGTVSPTMELWGSLAKMRDRARDLERNNPLVRRYLHLVAENVVGHKGIRLQARNVLPGPEEKPNSQANYAIEQAFCEWHKPATCTVEGRQSWVGFQQLVMKTVARDGEAFVRIVRPFPPYGIALQLIDADLVDESFNRSGKGGNAIRLGVEVDQWGRPVAYHVFKAHQNDLTTGGSRDRVRIPAEDMLHIFVARRPGQTRGESWLAPAVMPLRMLDGYAEAELVAARTAAAKMGFITRNENAVASETDDGRQREMEAAPGIIEELDVGEEFSSWDPTHPSGNFPTFVVQIEKIIAAGMNVSFASLSGDLREVNYSSIRTGLLQERDGWRALQTFCAEQFCEPVYLAWRDVAWMKGHLSLRMPPQEYTDHIWQARGWPWIDPQKDVMASALAESFGYTSPQRIVGEDGNDWEEIQEERSAARKIAEDWEVDLMLPQGVITDGQAGSEGAADANADGGSGSTGDAKGRGRAHPPLAVVRSAR